MVGWHIVCHEIRIFQIPHPSPNNNKIHTVLFQESYLNGGHLQFLKSSFLYCCRSLCDKIDTHTKFRADPIHINIAMIKSAFSSSYSSSFVHQQHSQHQQIVLPAILNLIMRNILVAISLGYFNYILPAHTQSKKCYSML